MMIPSGETAFLDTNVLLSATDESRSSHRAAGEVFSFLPVAGVRLALSGQVLREYLIVATRPLDANGFGLRPDHAVANVEALAERCDFCDEGEAVSAELRRLLRANAAAGKRIHDLNIVATMRTAGIRFLVTDNGSDFDAFPEISVVSITDAVVERD